MGRSSRTALLHFDGERYRMGDFVVMPNHVHLLGRVSKIPRLCEIAMRLMVALHGLPNSIKAVGRKRQVLASSEPFDHLVRSRGAVRVPTSNMSQENPSKGKALSSWRAIHLSKVRRVERVVWPFAPRKRAVLRSKMPCPTLQIILPNLSQLRRELSLQPIDL